MNDIRSFARVLYIHFSYHSSHKPKELLKEK